MKTNKCVIFVHLILLTFSGVALMMLEYNEFWQLRYLASKSLTFLDGHKAFYSSLMLGIFSSVLLVLVGAIISYRTEYLRLSDEMTTNYKLWIIEIRKILVGDNITYKEYEIMLSELYKYFTIQNSFRKQFSPICKLNKKNKIYLQINNVIYKAYEASICNGEYRIIQIQDKLSEEKKSYIKDLQELTNKQKVIAYYTPKIDELSKELEKEQQHSIKHYTEMLAEFKPLLKDINKYISFDTNID